MHSFKAVKTALNQSRSQLSLLLRTNHHQNTKLAFTPTPKLIKPTDTPPVIN